MHMNQKENRYTVIIVDDEESIRHGMVHYVDWKAMGFIVEQAFEDGRDALEYLGNHSVDVVLTDIKMADISGLKLSEYLYKNHPETAIIIMSGYRDFEYAKQAITYNARDYLLKPVEIDQLKRTFSTLHAEITERKSLSNLKQLLPMYDELLFKSLVEKKPESDHELEILITDLIKSGDTIEQETTKDDYIQAIIQKACSYIDNNLSRDISLEDVANHVHLSSVYFSRFFKEHNGKNFIIYLTEVRMQRAKELLDSREHRIQDISIMVGYQSSKYFTRVFKKRYGVTPTEHLHANL